MAALRRSGDYGGSEEELTPVRRDPIAATPVLLATVATLLRPAWWRWFVSSSVDNYALSPDGWRQVLDKVAVSARPGHSLPQGDV